MQAEFLEKTNTPENHDLSDGRSKKRGLSSILSEPPSSAQEGSTTTEGTCSSSRIILILVATLTASAIAVRWVMNPALIGLAHYTLLYPAVAVAAILSGWRAALSAALIGGGCSFYLFAYLSEQFVSAKSAYMTHLLLYAVVSLLIIAVAEWGRARNRRLQKSVQAQRERERRQAQQNIEKLKSELSEQNAALDESRKRWEAVVTSIADEIWLSDSQGKMSFLNVAAVNLMGLNEFKNKSVEEVLSEVEILTLDGKLRPPQQAPLLRSLRGETVRGDEIMRHRRTGTTRCRQYVSSPIRDASGAITAAVATVRDITEQKKTEEALRAAQISAEQAKAAAEQANAAKDQFLAVLSHELRTPLTPVLAAVQLMQRKNVLPDDVRSHLDIIRRNVQLEARLIDDLLDLTRIARGKISLERKRVLICTVISHVADVCKPDIEARKLHFGVDLVGAPHPIQGDPSRLQQILWNLLNNSIKFTPEDGCVGIRCYRENKNVIVEVNDSGIGIEKEFLPRVFNAFEQGDHKITRQFGGLGLGLAITRQLVHMHEGTISVYSGGRNKGSTFRVSFPLFPLETEAEKNEPIPHAEPAARTSRHILLVEDHGDTAAMMSKLLRVSGYEVETAGSVNQALAVTESKDFDAIISDLGLPDGSGLDIMRELRTRGSAVKGIALSGFGREEDMSRSREAGFAAHLTKPVDLDLLIRTLNSVL